MTRGGGERVVEGRVVSIIPPKEALLDSVERQEVAELVTEK